MKNANNATKGLLLGLVGVAVFSMTLPATRIGIGSFSPWFISEGRVVVAGILAAVVLFFTRQKFPNRRQLVQLYIIGLMIGLGFPMLATAAMSTLPASHGAITLALQPLATALAATIRAGERPSPLFWAASLIGSGAVIWYALAQGGGSLEPADLMLLGAVAASGVGYAEGARLSRELGSWQVISWVMVLIWPVLAIMMGFEVARTGITPLFNAPLEAWLCFLYVAILSQYVGFFAWYRGLAMGGVARVGQLQLLQPFMTLIISSFLLGEKITFITALVAIVVVGAVAIGRKAPVALRQSAAIRRATLETPKPLE
ncbi:MAG: DMT family transporter [Chloroflexi bacterium]|uniref:DMT family transporter n=1 Tax=Candidatus Chlorohelix allophototropha TaxID=3003348 RepID=A0A8T7LTG7_9CHLR|nr:DMT family transporter [Chloroflexota bacterium]WJW67189.1 DMT family transporter [Chloroflexota bacterium L227-S17]